MIVGGMGEGVTICIGGDEFGGIIVEASMLAGLQRGESNFSSI